MKHSDYNKEYRIIREKERAELAAAVMAHGGEYVFIKEDDEDWYDNLDVPIVTAYTSISDAYRDFCVSRVEVDKNGNVDIYGFDRVYEFRCDEREIFEIPFGQYEHITDLIPETDTVEDVSLKP